MIHAECGYLALDRPNTRLMSKTRSDKFNLLDAFRQSDPIGKTALVLSTWFGAGLLPLAPGTFGALLGIPLVLGMGRLDAFSRALTLAVLVMIAIWSSGRCEKILREIDPTEIVIDEVAGLALAISLLPVSLISLGCGFILFRCFDILKPFPIKLLENQLKGGLGVVMDDLVAGAYAALSTKILFQLLHRG